MAKYEVVRPWHGVSAGDIVDLKEVHPSLKSHVRLMKGAVAELVPATPTQTKETDRKSVIVARLKELEIKFDGRKGADDLSVLLPEGELENLFPTE